jgi:hypothetical protein
MLNNGAFKLLSRYDSGVTLVTGTLSEISFPTFEKIY